MSWISQLCRTYEHCSRAAGLELPDTAPLLPAMHTIVKAHVTVTINREGELIGIHGEEDSGTIVPVTDQSAGRSGKFPVPHPLVDKLQYLAGDYNDYFHVKKSRRFHHDYLDGLRAWRDSAYSHPALASICAYIERGTLVADMISCGVLVQDADGFVRTKWEDNEPKPPLYAIKQLHIPDVMARFEVTGLDDDTRTWRLVGLRDAFIQYMASSEGDTALCYVLGRELPYTENHPKKIVNTLANAKLISANDHTNYTYRGRFHAPLDAVSVSAEASQKAHAMLRWLVDTRGIRCGSKTIVAFSAGTGAEVVNPTASSETIIAQSEQTDPSLVIDVEADTARNYSDRLGRALRGRDWHKLDEHAPVVVMVLDAATAGRLSITLYREMDDGEYIESIKQWHESCVWQHDYSKKRCRGSPSFYDISDAALGFGAKVSDKVRAALFERLLSCVMDGAAVPKSVTYAAVKRAMNPLSFDEPWQWRKTLTVACALFNQQRIKEGNALSEYRHNRDYLYGELLAVADRAEWEVLNEMYPDKVPRPTNAIKFMRALAANPARVWPSIELRLQPYLKRMADSRRQLYLIEFGRIRASFRGDDATSRAALGGLFLHGFHKESRYLRSLARANQTDDGGVADTNEKESYHADKQN